MSSSPAENLAAVDGVRVLHRTGRGPTRATLSFRVGTVDEPVQRRGITRLVASIACAAAGRADDVDLGFTVTAFSVEGDPATVAHELGALSHSLRSPDPRILQRLIRAAGGAHTQHSPEHSWLLRARYGPLGWGADTVPEYAVRGLDLDLVAAWAGTYFVAGNAVLALSGDLPVSLRLPLTPGPAVPLGPGSPAVGRFPAFRRVDQDTIRLGGVVGLVADHDRAAVGVTARALRHRLDQALVERLGSRIPPHTGVLGLGPDGAHVAMWADQVDRQVGRALDVAVAAVEAAAGNDGITDDEAAFYIQRRLSSLHDFARSTHGAHALLDREAVGELTATPWTLAAEKTHLARVDGAALTGQAGRLHDSLLVLLPHDVRPPRPWPVEPDVAAPGTTAARRFRSRPAYGMPRAGRPLHPDRSPPSRLLVTDDGVTVAAVDRPDTSMRWADLRLTVRYDDGRRVLTDTTARTLDVEPERWLQPAPLVAALDERCPVETVVDAGPRATPPRPRRGVVDRLPGWVWPPLLLLCLLAVVAAVAPWWDPDLGWIRTTVGIAGFVGFFVTAAYAVDVWRCERRLRRPRPG